MAVTVTLLAALAVLCGGIAGAAGAAVDTSSCKKQCFVDVEANRFKAVGAGASGTTLTLTTGAAVTWRLRDTAEHTVLATTGIFKFGRFPGGTDLSFSMSPSAGRYDYRDTAGGAGTGTLVVLPRFDRLPDGGYEVVWSAPGQAPADRVHDVRWLLIQGADMVDSGSWHKGGRAGSRIVRPNRQKSTSTLRTERSLCVEVRTARGEPRRWSDWANACAPL